MGFSSTGTHMEMRGYAFPPPGFVAFCEARPDLCSTDGDDGIVDLTPELRSELDTVNRGVNRSIEQLSDLAATGLTEDWRLPLSRGDCEDIAIMKKHELMKRGWPASALLLTVGWLRRDGHAVLTVSTSEGDLVLDNRTDAIRDWSRTPYRYFARQTQGAGHEWSRIGIAQPLS